MKKITLSALFAVCIAVSFYAGMQTAYNKSAKGWYVSHIGNYGSADKIKVTLEIVP